MLKNYLVTAFKVFLRRKFFTFISLFAISFTLMVLMIATAFLDAMFGPNPPETRRSRILGIYSIHLNNYEGNASWDGPPGYKFLDRYARGIPGVEAMSIVGPGGYASTFYHNGEKIEYYGKATDGAFWKIMDFTFVEGSPYTEDDIRNHNSVAVINESTSRRLFGRESAVGQSIELFKGSRFRVAGVVKDISFLKQVPFADIWIPLEVASAAEVGQTNYYALLLARSAADVPAIKAEYQVRLKSVELGVPGIGGDDSGFGGTAYSAWKRIYSRVETFFELKTRGLDSGSFDFNWSGLFNMDGGYDVRINSPNDNPFGEKSRSNRSIAIIILVMVLFMLLPTVNLVNINISRIMERSGEVGVRKAFGASSWTLAGQFVTENVFLTLAGGAIGFLLARLVLHFITQSGWIPYTDFQVNYRIFLYALGLAVFFGLMSGVYPAWKMSRLHPVAALRGSTEGGIR